MSVLRNAKVVACVPDPADNIIPHFRESYVEDVKRVICDENGEVISQRIQKVAKTRIVDSSELENKGINYRMFSLENQLASGVNLQPAPAFGSPTLDERSNASDYVESVLSNPENFEQTPKTE